MDFSHIFKGLTIIWQNLDYLAWGNYPNGPVTGIMLTLLISLAAILLSTVLGVVAGIGLTVLKGWTRAILVCALGFLRAIPVIMLIFWAYFLLPVLFNVDVPAITTVIMALALIGGAYIAYAVYAGMIAISTDQWQAAYSLGLNNRQTIFYIILPQAIKMMMPSFINQWVSLIKDSSLAYIVGVAEFTFLAAQVNNRSMIYPTEIFLFVIMVYFIICFGLDMLMMQFIKRHYG
ncbi:amino acid ABC transporter permease [Orbus wheelerorum]|uniref:amino acid ABC transporter permease n=1 Tax=Orbus wheelerorum TaxID=3074111 RepID=UPI00370D0D61